MKTKGLLALAAALVALLLSAGESAAQQLPLAPIIYSGAVQVGDAPAPDGYSVYAQVEDYRSESVTVSNGRYGPLNVLPGEGRNYENKTIMFYLDGEPATQTDVFRRTNLPIIKSNFDLTFAKLPEPTPTPTAVPTDTPTPTPTVPATATPTVANAMTFVSGFVVSVSGGPVPADGALVARIGSYESEPAALTPDGGFVGLLVDPGDVSLIGQDVEFYLDGHKARTTVPFESGGFERQFDIVFVGLPQVEPTGYAYADADQHAASFAHAYTSAAHCHAGSAADCYASAAADQHAGSAADCYASAAADQHAGSAADCYASAAADQHAGSSADGYAPGSGTLAATGHRRFGRRMWLGRPRVLRDGSGKHGASAGSAGSRSGLEKAQDKGVEGIDRVSNPRG